MTSLLFLIPLSLLVLALAVILFFWAVRSGQYDDIDSAGWHVVMDDDRQPPPSDTQAGPSSVNVNSID